MVLLKCVDLDVFFFGGLSARDIPLRFPKMKQAYAFKGTIGVSELSHPNV